MPQHTPNQARMLRIQGPACRYSAGEGWVWGSKNQQCNTGRGGDDSICTLVGGPQVEQIQHTRAATGRRLEKWKENGMWRSQADPGHPGTPINGCPEWQVFWGGGASQGTVGEIPIKQDYICKYYVSQTSVNTTVHSSGTAN